MAIRMYDIWDEDTRKILREIEMYAMLYMNMRPFGLCMGYNREPHEYRDFKWHYKNSHGICPECKELYKQELDKMSQDKKKYDM